LRLVIRRTMGEEIRVDFNTGSGGGSGEGGSSGGAGVPPPPRASGGATGGEFDYRELVPSFIRTVREVILNPVNFYRGVPREGNFLSPVLFAVICSLISAVIGGILGFILRVVMGNGVGGSFGRLISTIIGAPIGTLIGLFIGAAIYHLLVLLVVRPRHEGYEATFKALAYASAVNVFSWLAFIPILGILVIIAISVYNVVLTVIGIREMHATTTGRAVAVVLIPVVVFGLLALLLLGAILAIIAAAVSQSQ
jgi:hypothetical protein